MKFIQEFRVGLRDLGIGEKLTNYGYLSFLENIATMHSDTVGYGVKDIKEKKRAWLLIDWKLSVIERPKFSEKVIVKTYSVKIDKPGPYVYRNFEIFDEHEKIIATATSKWVLFDTENLRIVKVDESLNELYNAEGSSTEMDKQMPRLREPAFFNKVIEYPIRRSDIDINKHVHNLNYLNMAYEVLPDEIYFAEEPKEVHIYCKQEIKPEETVKCFYTNEDGNHIITIKSQDEKIIHSIIKLK